MSISVVIPVGPYEANKRWLNECLESVLNQTMKAAQIIIVDDGADLDPRDVSDEAYDLITYMSMPWRTGISHSFNYGVATARTECVFLLGSDDTLEPECLERCWEAYNIKNKQDGYYSVPIKYMDSDEVQTLPCNAAMVTKGLWKRTGGFPIQTAIGIGDSCLLSILKGNYDDKGPDNKLVQWVGHLTGHDGEPLYNYRRHEDIHTYKLGPYWGIVHTLRDVLTREYDEDRMIDECKGYDIHSRMDR